ncbi:MAG: hypothetical protein QG642_446 [Patescibacteria group bacterium]|nr:hypothetical protein [Patescibacteria group bacterium]
MNGYVRPEIKVPKVESVANADFANATEQVSEKSPQRISETSHVLPSLDPNTAIQQASGDLAISDQQIILEKVEQVLAQDMDNVFLSLDVSQQIAFKKRGEETSRQIVKLLSKGSVPLKKIVNLIVAWLRVIPNVNRFYLEQEAKIKADRIMKLTIKK